MQTEKPLTSCDVPPLKPKPSVPPLNAKENTASNTMLQTLAHQKIKKIKIKIT